MNHPPRWSLIDSNYHGRVICELFKAGTNFMSVLDIRRSTTGLGTIGLCEDAAINVYIRLQPEPRVFINATAYPGASRSSSHSTICLLVLPVESSATLYPPEL